MNTILILGHTGLVGSSLFRFLSSLPHIEVFGLDRVDCDFSQVDSIAYLKNRLDQTKPDVVIVLAAIKRQDSDSKLARVVNNMITDNIASALADKRCHVIYFSSCAVYGEKNNQILYTEDSALDPTSDYGAHKVYSETVYSSLIDIARLLIIRPPLIYNPLLCNSYGPSLFLKQALSDKQISIWGDGSEHREFIHTTDVAYVVYALISLQVTSTINLVSGISYSYASIADFIASILLASISSKDRSIPSIVEHSYNPKLLYSCLPLGFKYRTPQQSIIEALSK